jgi:glucose-6-phosphate 1-dehydrogenase
MIEITKAHDCDLHENAATKKISPCTLVIFGITGDLAKRKLIPSLYELAADNQLPDSFNILGFARSKIQEKDLITSLEESVSKYCRLKPVKKNILNSLSNKIAYVQGQYDDTDSFTALKKKLSDFSGSHNFLFYLATPPGVYKPIISNLGKAGLIYPVKHDNWSRVIIEKPFGYDYDSAVDLNKYIANILDESQTYRTDHYLGKETVQNILIFRFANAIFEPLWNRNHIDHVQITAAESIGIEGRAGFYDQTGVIRDFIQNHLLEVMALCAMEQPISFEAEPIRNEKVKVLKNLRFLKEPDILQNVICGQYKGYTDTQGIEKDSRTPTYAAIKVMIDNWRWTGVPFFIRAGKNLSARSTEVAFHFKSVPICMLGTHKACKRLKPNVLKLRLQPNEGIELSFGCKIPGDNIDAANVNMNFGYEEAFGKTARDAYERLLLDAMRGDATLFTRRDEVEDAWAFISPVIEYFENETNAPLYIYKSGSDGPKEANQLLSCIDCSWDPISKK